jgi:hypothetical protein
MFFFSFFLSFLSFLDRSSRKAWGLNANATACQVRVPFTHRWILSSSHIFFRSVRRPPSLRLDL